MKRIPYVADIHFENTTGKPLYCRVGSDPGSGVLTSPDLVLGNGATLKLLPCTVSHLDFLFERVSDPAFVATEPKLKTFEAGGRQHSLRHELRIQADKAKVRGYWEIADEDDYTRLRNAVMSPAAPLSLESIAFNYHPFAVAVCNANTPAEEPVHKATNGAGAEHDTAQAS